MRILFFSFSLLVLFSGGLKAQSYNIGVRAGLNYNKFLGPLEQNESYHFSSGFHFGLSYQYNFIDNLGLRVELQYTQTGGRKEYTGPSFYVLRTTDEVFFEEGTLSGTDENGDGVDDIPGYLLEVSNAYINFPITLHAKISKKFEILGGAYVGLNINPTANGRLQFDSTDNPEDIYFIQSLSYNYYRDEALQSIPNPGFTTVYVNDDPIGVARVAQAYYQQAEKEKSSYKLLDIGVVGGLNYYFNKGFYAGARVNYGFLDVTRNSMDFSLRDYNADKTFVTRDDKDTNFGLEFSLGFKF